MLTLALLLVVQLGSPGERAEDGFARAFQAGDQAFALRGVPGQIEVAVREYARASEIGRGEPSVELRLARAFAFQALADPGSARTAWSSASRAAERALRALAPAWAAEIDRGAEPAEAVSRVQAPGAEALYWFALASFSSAQTRGYAAVLSVKDDAIACMQRAAALDERIDYAGPHRALGAWLAALPSAAGGSAAASRSHFERARALFPLYFLTAVKQAETYAVLTQNRKLFESSLTEVLSADESAHPAMAPENRIAKRLARALLDSKAGLF
jgi:hypothetical protein